MNQYCVFYIVRHGETDWNVQKKIQGHIDIPLNKNGELQAAGIGKKLGDIHFEAAFSSDLLRARRTVELILLERKIIIETTKALRERNFGKWQGKHISEIHLLEQSLEKYKQLSEKGVINKDYEDIETDDDVIRRLMLFLREIAVAYAGKTVLIGTHGGIMRNLLNHLGFFSKSISEAPISNTSYIRLESDGVDFFVKETFGIKAI